MAILSSKLKDTIGDSLVEDEALETAKELLKDGGSKLRLPVDVVLGDKFDAEAATKTIPVGPIPDGWRILDIGPETIKHYGKVVEAAGTVVWNGPMGVFEFPKFAVGTYGIAKEVAASKAISIIGGGYSVAAIQESGLSDKSPIFLLAAAPPLKCLKVWICPA
jgi:phosphoglycerate kinase